MTAFNLRRGGWALACLLAVPTIGMADGVSVAQDAIFPSNRYTVPDSGNATQRRVSLPLPNCAARPSDCADIAVINTLDGFSTQPRITVPFSGAIDPASVDSKSVFLLNLGDVMTQRGFGERVGINQVVWDPASRTLAFESDELLQERSRYLLVLTNQIRDPNGKKLERVEFPGGTGDAAREVRDALPLVRGTGRGHNVVAATVFTTQSATGDLLKIQQAIKRSAPAPVDFMLGNGGAVRSVFDVNTLAGVQLNRQISTAAPPVAVPGSPFFPVLFAAGATVGKVAYGRFNSPMYQNAGKVIPATPTNDAPIALGSQQLVFQLFVPAGAKPAGGWPVALFGHGFTDSMFGAPWAVASVFAQQGIATMSINVVGHGGGAQGFLNVQPAGGGTAVTVPAGGRGIDQNGDGDISATEGVSAAPPATIVDSRDGLRQTVVDLMQLVRQVEAGIDVDADGSRDLNADRIYYAGQSFGGIYGTMLLGVEPNIKAGVPNVPGGSITEIARLSASFRGLTGLSLFFRAPSLLNLAPTAQLPFPFNFNENIPLRDQPPVVNTVPGAFAIAELLDRNEWVQQSGNPVSYASLIRKSPPQGHLAKPVIVQVAKGDQTVPNPTSTAIVRAGALQDRTTYFRNDLANAANAGIPKNPHTFLTNLNVVPAAPLAVAAQTQIAVFFATNGGQVIDPDGAGPLFEVPISGELPESLNFIP